MPPSARRISRLVGTPVVEAQSAAPGDEMVEAMIGHACENPPPRIATPIPATTQAAHGVVRRRTAGHQSNDAALHRR